MGRANLEYADGSGDCGSRRDGVSTLRIGPVPGQQFIDAPGRMAGEAGENIAEPGCGIDAVELGGLDQRVDGGGALAAGVGAGKQPVLAVMQISA